MLAAPGHLQGQSAPDHPAFHKTQPTGEAIAAPASVHRVLASSGRPLDPALQQDMAQRFGHDFSQVEVHSGAAAEQSARDVNSLAYTVGHKIVFGAGQFAPATNDGRRLIAHELAHVVQQSDRIELVLVKAMNNGVRPLICAGMSAFNTGEYLPDFDKRLLVHELVHVTKSTDDTTLRRAEVEDRDSKCSQLTDVSADVNNWVNQELTKARTPQVSSTHKSFLIMFLKKPLPAVIP